MGREVGKYMGDGGCCISFNTRGARRYPVFFYYRPVDGQGRAYFFRCTFFFYFFLVGSYVVPGRWLDGWACAK